MTEKNWWVVSFTAAFIFAALVAYRWYIEDSSYQPNECQLADELRAQGVLLKYMEENNLKQFQELQISGKKDTQHSILQNINKTLNEKVYLQEQKASNQSNFPVGGKLPIWT